MGECWHTDFALVLGVTGAGVGDGVSLGFSVCGYVCSAALNQSLAAGGSEPILCVTPSGPEPARQSPWAACRERLPLHRINLTGRHQVAAKRQFTLSPTASRLAGF